MRKPSNSLMSRADEEVTSIWALRKNDHRNDNTKLELVKEDEMGMNTA